MKFDRTLLQTFQSLLPVQIFIAYCFVAGGLIINFAQVLTWIFIWGFNKQLYRRINYYLGSLLWSRKCLKQHRIRLKRWLVFCRINLSLFLVG
jgi:hypothetical protein